MEIHRLYEVFLQCTGVSIDSRKCEEGSMFFALKGNTDGNQFASAALTAGARIAVVDDVALAEKEFHFFVADTLVALQELALYHRKKRGIPVLAITGSNGKTTTKELIAAVLAKKYVTWATPGNYNNHIGVPLTLLSMPPDAEMAVVEMGASGQGEIALLCKIAEPDAGLITNIGNAHLEGFGGAEGVRKGKGELLDWIKDHRGTFFYLAVEHPIPQMVADYPFAKCIQFGEKAAEGVVSLKQDIPSIIMEFMDGSCHIYQIDSCLFGDYNARNIAIAITVGNHYGVPGTDIAQAIASYIPSNSRSQIKEHNNVYFILDDYNANDRSMSAAIGALSGMHYEKKLAIIGDMKELGDEGPALHQQIVDLLLGHNIPAVLVGPIFGATNHPAAWPAFPDALSAGEWVKRQDFTGYGILVKGSNSMQMRRAVADLLPVENG